MICKYCNKEKKESDFVLHNKSKCRKCLCEYQLVWLNKKPGRREACNKRRRNKQSKYYIKWYAKNGRVRTQKDIDAINRWAKNNQVKLGVSRKLRYAVETGKIKKPKVCSLCRRLTKIHGHHPDYNKPLAVVWCCASCHRKIHNGSIVLQRETFWQRLKEVVK